MLREPHSQVLVALADGYESDYERCFYHFEHIAQSTGLDTAQVRRSCRFLARKGLARYARGLWTEDGEPFGSGYAATKAGNELANTLPRICESCGQHPADLPSHICVGCDAYREHQR